MWEYVIEIWQAKWEKDRIDEYTSHKRGCFFLSLLFFFFFFAFYTNVEIDAITDRFSFVRMKKISIKIPRLQ